MPSLKTSHLAEWECWVRRSLPLALFALLTCNGGGQEQIKLADLSRRPGIGGVLVYQNGKLASLRFQVVIHGANQSDNCRFFGSDFRASLGGTALSIDAHGGQSTSETMGVCGKKVTSESCYDPVVHLEGSAPPGEALDTIQISDASATFTYDLLQPPSISLTSGTTITTGDLVDLLVTPAGNARFVNESVMFTLRGNGGVAVTNYSLAGDHLRFTAPSFSGTGLDCSSGCPATLTVGINMGPFCIDASPCPGWGGLFVKEDLAVTVR